MRLEFHQLERRWKHLRVHEPHRQRQLIASLAEAGQQTPIVVVPAEQGSNRYVVIDGYKRIVALEQLRQAGSRSNSMTATSSGMPECERRRRCASHWPSTGRRAVKALNEPIHIQQNRRLSRRRQRLPPM